MLWGEMEKCWSKKISMNKQIVTHIHISCHIYIRLNDTCENIRMIPKNTKNAINNTLSIIHRLRHNAVFITHSKICKTSSIYRSLIKLQAVWWSSLIEPKWFINHTLFDGNTVFKHMSKHQKYRKPRTVSFIQGSSIKIEVVWPSL